MHMCLHVSVCVHDSFHKEELLGGPPVQISISCWLNIAEGCKDISFVCLHKLRCCCCALEFDCNSISSTPEHNSSLTALVVLRR